MLPVRRKPACIVFAEPVKGNVRDFLAILADAIEIAKQARDLLKEYPVKNKVLKAIDSCIETAENENGIFEERYSAVGRALDDINRQLAALLRRKDNVFPEDLTRLLIALIKGHKLVPQGLVL